MFESLRFYLFSDRHLTGLFAQCLSLFIYLLILFLFYFYFFFLFFFFFFFIFFFFFLPVGQRLLDKLTASNLMNFVIISYPSPPSR